MSDYAWQNDIKSGDVIKNDFYDSIKMTYDEVVTNGCSSNYSTHKSSNDGTVNVSEYTSYTTCSANDAYHTSYDKVN